jgi:succinate-semialdehyde dehydrogenase/glutarate-semialdehyde dehydrogenase
MSTSVLSSQVKDQSLIVSSGLVNGEWRTGANGKTFNVSEPSTNTTLLECADLDKQDFVDAIASAKIGTKEFHENTTAKERGALLRKWYDLIIANSADST